MLNLRIEINPLADKAISGVGQYTKRLAEALNQHSDINLTGFYFDPRGTRPQPKTKINFKRLTISQKILAKLVMLGFRPPFDRKLPQVDATFFPNFVTWPSKKSTLKITTIHDLTYLRFPKTVEAKNLAFLKKIVPQTIKRADLILTVSQTIKQELLETFSVNSDRVLALPIPPSATFVKFQPAKQLLAPQLNIPTKNFLLFVGNFEPRKNLQILVKGFLQLPTKVRQNLSLVIAGSRGWSNNTTQKLIDEAVDNGENIIQTGNLSQEQVAQLMFESFCLVMPSIYEGFGMPIIEAMSVGKTIIAADIPVLHETANETALFFNPHSSKDLAKTIAKLIKNPSLRHELAKKGQAYANSLSWTDNAQKIYEKVNQLLAQKTLR